MVDQTQLAGRLRRLRTPAGQDLRGRVRRRRQHDGVRGLLASDRRVVSTEELLERVWDEEADPFTTAVKTTIRRLRAKLGDPPVIHTVREGGYRIGDA